MKLQFPINKQEEWTITPRTDGVDVFGQFICSNSISKNLTWDQIIDAEFLAEEFNQIRVYQFKSLIECLGQIWKQKSCFISMAESENNE